MGVDQKELRLDPKENSYYTIAVVHARNTENLSPVLGIGRREVILKCDIITATRENK